MSAVWASWWSRLRGLDDNQGPTELPVRVKGTEFSRTAAAPAHVHGIDQPLLWVVAALVLWGLVMVYSASIAMPDNPRFANYSPYHFLARHAFSILIALVLATLVFQVPIDTWERWAPWIFVLSLVLLILVLIPFIGKGVNGARRWIALGVMNFQPSELAKLGVLLYAANYMVRKMDVKEKFFTSVAPMGLAVAVVGSLLLAEPDMGAFMVIAVIAMGILFLGGVNARMFFLIAFVLVVAFGLMIALSEWRRERIFAYLDPWSKEHAIGKGYQLSHALIAIGATVKGEARRTFHRGGLSPLLAQEIADLEVISRMAHEDRGLALGTAAEDGQRVQVLAVIEAGFLQEGLGLGRQWARSVVERLRHQAGAEGGGANGIMIDMKEPGGPGGQVGGTERGGHRQDRADEQG